MLLVSGVGFSVIGSNKKSGNFPKNKFKLLYL